MLLIGSRHRRDSCSEAYRFARSGAAADPKVDCSSGLLSWGSSIRPSADTTVTASTSRPGRRLDFGSGLPRPEHVPFLPFLPASTVSSAAEQIRRPTRSTVCGFVAPRSRPWGSPRFGLPALPLGRARPEGRGPEGPRESSPVANTLRSVPLLGSFRPCRHRVSSFRTRSRSPTGVPSRRSSRARSRVATARCSARRPQGFAPPRSPLRCARRCRCAPARCSLGL